MITESHIFRYPPLRSLMIEKRKLTILQNGYDLQKMIMQIQAILRKIATIESMKVNHDKFGTIEEPRESRTLPAEAAADFHDGAIV